MSILQSKLKVESQSLSLSSSLPCPSLENLTLLSVDDKCFLLLRATFERCFSQRTFSYFAPSLLNRLPTSLKESDSIATFKSKFKTFMFARAFDLNDRSVNESYNCSDKYLPKNKISISHLPRWELVV